MISLLETLLNSDIGFSRCLIITPLNAVLNWVSEWEKWVKPEIRPPVSQNLFWMYVGRTTQYGHLVLATFHKSHCFSKILSITRVHNFPENFLSQLWLWQGG